MKYSILIFLLVIVSCGLFEPYSNGIPDDIDNFVSDYAFEKQQATELLFTSVDKKLRIFWVKYGDGMDCPSGCIYSKMIGIKVANHIGWFEDNYFPASVTNEYEVFDVTSQDTIMFNPDIWEDLQSDRSWIMRDYYLTTLARDEDTPSASLLVIIEWMHTQYYHDLDNILLSNPTVISDEHLLQGLACLPETLFGYDVYGSTIDSAKLLLGDRFTGCD